MTWGMVAVAGATVVGGVLASNAAGDAADSQAQSSAASIAEQRRQYDQTREDFAPYRAAGVKALGQYADANTLDGSDLIREVQNDPGYQFGQQQGQLGLDRKIAAAGGRISGAALKQSSRFNTDFATTGFNAAYQRRQDRLNRLAALANIGQTSTAGSAAAGASSANAISNLIGSQGDASAAAGLAQANIWGNTGNQLAALYGRNRTPATTPGTSNGFNYGSIGSGAIDSYGFGTNMTLGEP